ncbi:hypothetical protein [Gracilibacillus halophilus]|uniref:hypothetical protein n=1 Tax=Gracilibacillus halophilus TaxID=470864 RepID=UPI00039AC164|nr:hypothetical protein [Gracilibacillus halophilus]
MFFQYKQMLAFQWRLNRFRFLVWSVALVFVTVVTASAFTGLYQSDAERQAAAETMKNPAMIAMIGPGYGVDNYTNGAMMAHEMFLFTAMVFAIMSILFVSKHTRAEEEDGRNEWLRSLPVGRLAPLTATVILVSALNIIVGVLIGGSLSVANIEGIPVEGSILYGVSLAVTG